MCLKKAGGQKVVLKASGRTDDRSLRGRRINWRVLRWW